jgi:hypothetical protein
MRRVMHLVAGMLVVAMLGYSIMLVHGASRPAWFTAGGPLRDSLEDTPIFSPMSWKRRCLGVTWLEQRPNGEWLGCAGAIVGPRIEYLHLTDTHRWSPGAVPSNLDAQALMRQVRPTSHSHGKILSWRRSDEAEEVLLFVEDDPAHCALVRAQRHFKDESPAWERFISLDAPAAPIVELSHHPDDNDLARFVNDSWWALTETSPQITDWRIDGDAWRKATGNSESHELRNELERLKYYVFTEHTGAVATGRENFALLPGRSVVLPERSAAAVRNQCSRADVPNFEATWKPSPNDVEALENRLHELNPILYRGGASSKHRTPLHVDVNHYYRQYCGLVVDGKRLIYINALLSGLVDSNWRTEPFVICDGGWSAWGVLYDPTNGHFSQLYINGLA